MQIETVIVPGNVKDILSNAFTNSLIKSIILEEGVTTIHDDAFTNGHHFYTYIKEITSESTYFVVVCVLQFIF